MNLKQMVGIEAANYVKDGMVVGLGTGSTAYYMVEEIGRRVKEENLSIIGVTTSKQTEAQAKNLGIPLKSIDEVKRVDITIDGADEISADFNGIKGGGAALLFEKIVASYSDKIIWIVDESKMVNQLGRFPLPVEVIPYGSQQLLHLFETKGFAPTLRIDENGQPILTDSLNYIIDLHMDLIKEPLAFSEWLNNLAGVVENGIFAHMVDCVIVGRPTGVETIEVNKREGSF